MRRSRGAGVTVADLCRIANSYAVSLEALVRRLEELRLISVGTWEKLLDQGFRVREAQAILELPEVPRDEQLLPERYVYLAVEAYRREDLTEGQLASFLRTSRVAARELVEDRSEFDISEGGALQLAFLDLATPIGR